MTKQKEPGAVLTPIKAIRAKCVDCSAGSLVEVRECVIKKCPLYPYRMGRRPKENDGEGAAGA